MPDYPAILLLLESQEEPSRTAYESAIHEFRNNPHSIRKIILDDFKEPALLCLASRSHRLTQFFRELHVSQKEKPRNRTGGRFASGQHHLSEPPTRDRMAEEITGFLSEILPAILDVIEIPQTIELLVSALENCLLASNSSLHKLASMIASQNSVLEHLAADEAGGKVVYGWVMLKIITTQDETTLETWTRRLADLVDTCLTKHEIPDKIERCRKLNNLVRALCQSYTTLELESQMQFQEMARTAAFSSARMVPLDLKMKKSHVAGRQSLPNPPGIVLDEDLQSGLQSFSLMIPTTLGQLQKSIDTLRSETMILMLRDIAKTFPCKLCKAALGIPVSERETMIMPRIQRELNSKYNLELDIFGTPIGDWKVLLSTQALKSIQGLSRSSKYPDFEK